MIIKLHRILPVTIILTLAVLLAGCVATTPQVGISPTGQPVTNTVYQVSPALATNAATAQEIAALVSGIAAVVPQSAPIAPFIPSATTAILGLVALISGAFAAYKNNQATTHVNAAAALASAIVAPPLPPGSGAMASANLKDAAMSAAQLNGSVGAVAQHLANASAPV
jgi:cell division septum initiation protein DivIVA